MWARHKGTGSWVPFSFPAGKSDEARQTLARLRELVTNPRRFGAGIDGEWKQLVAKAEALIDPPIKPKEGPGP